MKLKNLFCLNKNKQNIDRLLYDYVCEKKYKKVIKLLKNGANPNITIYYNNPIDVAIHNQDLKMIRILIFYGAILKEQSKLFCFDCRNNFDYINMIYDIYYKFITVYLNYICKNHNIPYGLDNYLKSFIKN